MTPAELQPLAGLAAGGLGLYCLRRLFAPAGAMVILGLAGCFESLPPVIQGKIPARMKATEAQRDAAFRWITTTTVLSAYVHLLAGAALCFVAGLLLRGSL